MYKSVSELLIKAFQEFRNGEGGWNASQADFAAHVGIEASTMSTYILGRRKPEGANLHKLARVTGPRIYDAVGEPRPMPEDPRVRRIVDLAETLGEEDLQKLEIYLGQLSVGTAKSLPAT